MSEFKKYSPIPGSLPWRIIRYLLENPGMKMDRAEIVNTFLVQNPLGIDGNLRMAVDRGALTQTRDDRHRLVWGMGPSDNVRLKEARDDYEEADDEVDTMPAHNPFQLTVKINFLAIPIVRDATLQHPDRASVQFQQWLSSFSVGASAEFPVNYRPDPVEVEKYSAAIGAKFKIEQIAHGQYGIERIA